MSLFTATDEEPEPSRAFAFIDTSPENKARFETYKLLFKDKSPPTDTLPFKDESLPTNNFVPIETSDATYSVLRSTVKPLTSNANPADTSLFTETDEEPEPNRAFALKDASPKTKIFDAALPKLTVPPVDRFSPIRTEPDAPLCIYVRPEPATQILPPPIRVVADELPLLFINTFPLWCRKESYKYICPLEISVSIVLAYKVLRNTVTPLTSNAIPALISLLIATDDEPDPTSRLPSIETSNVKTERFATYKLPATCKLLLNDESPSTSRLLLNETLPSTLSP